MESKHHDLERVNPRAKYYPMPHFVVLAHPIWQLNDG
ncbi:Uncharacterised protein [Vibrio cholerae]|nr:Uncharacterised protein [Vibrio cholerae]